MAWDIRTGAWTEPELDLIGHAVAPGDVVLDIGANFGLWSYHLARATRPTGRVLAFEPVAFTHGCLRRVATLLRFRDVEMLPVGCGERGGRLAFSAPTQDAGLISAGLVHLGSRASLRPGGGEQRRSSQEVEIWCDVVRLDDLLPELTNLSFVKCDIEGAELFALRGAERLIDSHLPTVVCEIDPSFLAGFGLDAEDVVRFFTSREYRMFRYAPEPWPRLVPVPSAEALTGGNVVFVHPARLSRVSRLCG